jgi:hypothetical protein
MHRLRPPKRVFQKHSRVHNNRTRFLANSLSCSRITRRRRRCLPRRRFEEIVDTDFTVLLASLGARVSVSALLELPEGFVDWFHDAEEAGGDWFVDGAGAEGG